MTIFILGVVSSLAATALAVMAGWIGSRRMRTWPIAILSKMTGLGIKRSYAQQSQANQDLGADLANARWVKVLAGRGNELTRDSFRHIWQEADSRLEAVQILLPDPDRRSGSFLTDRETELRRHDPGYTPGLLSEQVISNIDYVSTIANKQAHVGLRLYNLPNVCRIIATDRVAYFTTYTSNEHGRNSPCLVFGNPGPMYDFLLRMFSTTWNHARPVARLS